MGRRRVHSTSTLMAVVRMRREVSHWWWRGKRSNLESASLTFADFVVWCEWAGLGGIWRYCSTLLVGTRGADGAAPSCAEIVALVVA